MHAIFYIFLAAFGVQILYYFLLFFRFVFYKARQQKNTFEKTVSVLLSAKNEAENCQKFIPYILKQDYPNFELVLSSMKKI